MDNETQDDIGRFLDAAGWAVMSIDLERLFIGSGCQPKCHICDEAIAVGARLHLKPFATKVVPVRPWSIGPKATDPDSEKFEVPIFYNEDSALDKSTQTTTVSVMVCERCSLEDRPLGVGEARAVFRLAGLDDETEAQGTTSQPVYPKTKSFGGCYLVRRGDTRTIVSARSAEASET